MQSRPRHAARGGGRHERENGRQTLERSWARRLLGLGAGARSRSDCYRPAQAIAPGGAPHAARVEPGLTITLRVYNYARIPTRTLNRAERETTWIFRQTGVETVWVDCRVSTAEPRTPACEQPFSSSDLFLRLLPPRMAQAVVSDADTFGIAVATKVKAGTDAFILCGRVGEQARAEHLDEQDILAAVMAHEIGHLLLGRGHSPTGIMRAEWNREQLIRTARRQLQFTPEQSLLIRDEVAARRANRDGRGQ
jgi:hypothetical protein